MAISQGGVIKRAKRPQHPTVDVLSASDKSCKYN